MLITFLILILTSPFFINNLSSEIYAHYEQKPLLTI